MMTTAKQKAWRKIFGQRYGKKKGSKAKVSHRSQSVGFNMAKKGRRGRSKGSSGIMSYILPAGAGGVAGILAPNIPVVNGIPYSSAIAGAIAGYITKRSVKSALIGAVAGYFAPSVMSGASSLIGTDNAW